MTQRGHGFLDRNLVRAAGVFLARARPCESRILVEGEVRGVEGVDAAGRNGHSQTVSLVILDGLNRLPVADSVDIQP